MFIYAAVWWCVVVANCINYNVYIYIYIYIYIIYIYLVLKKYSSIRL